MERADPYEMLESLASLRRDLETTQRSVAAGEAESREALERALLGILELSRVVEGLVADYRIRY